MRQILIILAFFWAGTAQASQIEITSIDSWWSDAQEFGNANVGMSADKNELRWGRSWTGTGERSGFRFDQLAAGSTHDAGKQFDVGEFTHMNRVIFRGEHLQQATLNMKVKARFDGGEEQVFETSYIFTLLETDNLAKPCANGGDNRLGINRNGCADRVELLQNPSLAETFSNPDTGLEYQFELLGFASGKEFWTVEDLDNAISLKARFTAVGQPYVTPLPAGAWLLLGGIGALAALRRRRARG